MFKKLSDSLRTKYNRKDELSRQLEIVRIFDIYRKELKKIFPQNREAKPVSLKNQILTVQTKSSVAANELRLKESRIIEKINQETGKEVIRKILYRF